MPRRSASPPLSRRHRDESPRGARGYDDRGSSRPDERERDRDRRQPDRDDRRRYEDDRRSGRGRRQDDYRAGPRDDRRVDRLDSRRDDRRDNRRDDRHDERHDDRRDDRRGPDAERPRSRSPVPAQAEDPNKGKPNFKPSGLLAAETKTVASADGTKTVLKYHEPPEARKPLVGWRLYVFKGTEQVDLMHIQRQSAYLVGRDKLVVDIPVEHPSCSKQHAVIQYRYIQTRDEFGDVKGSTKPYIIDLESTNGTKVNETTIPPAQYYELHVNDVIKFGDSLREYVLLHDDAA